MYIFMQLCHQIPICHISTRSGLVAEKAWEDIFFRTYLNREQHEKVERMILIEHFFI